MDSGKLEMVKSIIDSLQQSQAAKYLHGSLSDVYSFVNSVPTVTSAALFVWDHVVTLEEEIRLVWPSRWGAGKIIFLVARYMTWPEVIVAVYREVFRFNPRLCHPLFTYVAWSTLIGISVSEMILVLRTWAIWNGNRVILALLSAVHFCFTVVGCYMNRIYISETEFVAAATLSPDLRGCFVTASTRLVSVAWISVTVFDFAIVILTMIKGVQHFRTGTSGLMTSLYRDGLLYFVYLFTISLANLLVLNLAPAEYTTLLTELERVLYAMFACRVILHLRAAGRSTTAASDTVVGSGNSGIVPAFRHSRKRGRHEETVSGWFGNVSSLNSDATEVELGPAEDTARV